MFCSARRSLLYGWVLTEGFRRTTTMSNAFGPMEELHVRFIPSSPRIAAGLRKHLLCNCIRISHRLNNSHIYIVRGYVMYPLTIFIRCLGSSSSAGRQLEEPVTGPSMHLQGLHPSCLGEPAPEVVSGVCLTTWCWHLLDRTLEVLGNLTSALEQ